MTRPGLLIAGLLALSGCTRAEVPAPRVPLQYDSSLKANGFGNPVAPLVLDGDTAWFLFDTGAGVHTLASWFVEGTRAGTDARLARGVRGVDGTGAPVRLRAIGPTALRRFDGREIEVGGAMVADFPPVFEELRVGGLLNPRLLASDSVAVVMDLRVPELSFEGFDRAVSRLGARVLGPDQYRVCRIAHAPVPNVLYALRARSDGGAGWLDLDSGAERSDILAASDLLRGRDLVAGGTLMGIAGREQSHRVARDLAVRFSGFGAVIDAAVVDGRRQCGEDGRLGLDVMKRCAFVFGWESVALACDP